MGGFGIDWHITDKHSAGTLVIQWLSHRILLLSTAPTTSPHNLPHSVIYSPLAQQEQQFETFLTGRGEDRGRGGGENV